LASRVSLIKGVLAVKVQGVAYKRSIIRWVVVAEHLPDQEEVVAVKVQGVALEPNDAGFLHHRLHRGVV
jgi:hypothetical protein